MYRRKIENLFFVLIGVLTILYLPFIALSSEVLFEMKQDNIPYYREGKVFSVWNPRGLPEIRTSGLKIFFFGNPEGCLPDSKNGNIKTITPDPNLTKFTGLPAKASGKIFTPIQDKKFCDIKDSPREGGSLVYIVEDFKDGGVGIFTASGVDEKGNSYFFQTRGEEGVGEGVNKFEKVTAVTWRVESETLVPFKDNKTLKIFLTSSVTTLPSNLKERSLPIQVRQQIEIGFANRDCLKTKEEHKILCLNKFVFDLLVKRWGGKPLNYERGCLIFFDKGQGGLPHIACFSKSNGVKLIEKESQLDVATSCGDGLYQDSFRNKKFCYTISWAQFLQTLKVIASKHLNKRITQITERDLKLLFGKNYNHPDSWYITVISFQQELHNPYREENVFIGGNLKHLRIE